ncbi:MAG: phosphate ABC transporter ATP-binding protein [Thermoleophilia bacterium]|nr:phosphate ABC transporter ATP-binding protein [Thermoleophilia bacterium]
MSDVPAPGAADSAPVAAPAPQPRRGTDAPPAADGAPVPLRSEGLSCLFSGRVVVEDATIAFPTNTVTAIIGPSGCGKSTYIRALNRMHEAVPGATTTGRVLLHDHDIYGRRADPVAIRRRIGMVFQRPNPFPTKSVADNVLAGVAFTRTRLSRAERTALVESTLRGAGLWDEVKNRLHSPAGGLSGGQQQRLCIARALAVEPAVLLMDEPCSALDPQSTQRIEDLIHELKQRITVVIVTHNMQQAARVSDFTAFFTIRTEGEPGKVVEAGPTRQIFGAPKDPQTEAYVSGRFG